MNLLEFLEIQNEIISEQASAIGDLLGILRQYMTIDEIEALSVKEKIAGIFSFPAIYQLLICSVRSSAAVKYLHLPGGRFPSVSVCSRTRRRRSTRRLHWAHIRLIWRFFPS